MPVPWNWKPHFWMTRREAMFMTRQRASIWSMSRVRKAMSVSACAASVA